MYYKGGSMLHTIRHIVPDGAQWRGILRGINGTFDASPGLTNYEHDSRFTLAQPAARNASETRIVIMS